MKKSFILISIVIFLLSAASIWYFSSQRLADKQKEYIVPKTTDESPSPITSDTTQGSPPHLDKTGGTPKDIRTPDVIEESPITTGTDNNTEKNMIEETDTEHYHDNNHNVATPEQMESEHSHLTEEVEFAALLQEVFLARQRRTAEEEKTTEIKDRAAAKLVNMLNAKSPDEQHEFFVQAKRKVFNDIPMSPMGESLKELSSLIPDFDLEEALNEVWDSLIASLVDQGYTLPEGVESE